MDHSHPLPPTTTTTNIVKRKRTKRQRLQFVSNSPPSHNATSSSSTTTEDEDTAKCLILLSKGHNNYNDEFSGYKFTSKRYIQTSTDNASGFAYVYECKTCSRTFPSFQALGGHRASHRKPKIKEFDQRQLSSAFSDEDELIMQFPSKKNNSSSSSSISVQLNNSKKSSTKLHECSICGSEFNSGQALGGHMRRHRVTNAAANTTLSLIPYSSDQNCRNDGLCLDLDLNLPAPPETAAERRESSTADQNKQQPVVRLSVAPTLVDCHY